MSFVKNNVHINHRGDIVPEHVTCKQGVVGLILVLGKQFFCPLYICVFLCVQASPELTNIWAVGQKLWQRDFPAIYEALQKEWTEPYRDLLNAVRGKGNLLNAVQGKRVFSMLSGVRGSSQCCPE